MKITSCRFQCAAHQPQAEPRTPGPDVVFLGGSNVGKSSLINRLLGVKGLARTSSQPGRTQSIHFYRVNEAYHFVDLPGYGFARAPLEVRRRWGPMVEGFLERRLDRIVLALLLVDARRRPSELDRVMQDWLEARGLPYVVAATKSDKLSGNGRAQATRTLKETFAGVSPEPLLVSSNTGRGVRELWRHLDQALIGRKKKG